MIPVCLELAHFSSIEVTPRTTWVFAEIYDNHGASQVVEITSRSNAKQVSTYIRDMIDNVKGVKISHDSDLENLLGLDPQKIRSEVQLTIALSAIRTATVCLQSQYNSSNLTELLSGTRRNQVPLYANINRSLLGQNRTVMDFAKAAERAVENGFSTIKCAPFDEVTPGMKLENIIKHSSKGIDRVKAVRAVIGDSIGLLVDCHSRFTLNTAPLICEQLNKLNVDWFEEPVSPTENPSQLTQIAKQVNIPVAGGENGYGSRFFSGLVKKKVVDIVMPDIKFCGGASEAYASGLSVTQVGGRISLHNPSGPISQLISAHVTASIPHSMHLEHPVHETEWRKDVMSPPEEIKDGLFWIPEGTGIGASLNEKMIDEKGIRW